MQINPRHLCRIKVTDLSISDIFIYNNKLYITLLSNKEVVFLDFKTHNKDDIDKSDTVIYIGKHDYLMKLIYDNTDLFVEEVTKIVKRIEDREKSCEGSACAEGAKKQYNNSQYNNENCKPIRSREQEFWDNYRYEQSQIYGTQEYHDRVTAEQRWRNMPPSY